MKVSKENHLLSLIYNYTKHIQANEVICANLSTKGNAGVAIQLKKIHQVENCVETVQ